MKIGIIGNGVVGSATAKVWRGHCDEVRVYDAVGWKSPDRLSNVLDCDFVFVCLPTPQNRDGNGIDTDALVCFFERLDEEHCSANFVIKSTVPIGFTKATKWQARCPNVVHSPEFLTARTAGYDALNPRVNVVGIPNLAEYAGEHPLEALYERRFPNVNMIAMDSNESEAMKLVMNSWFGVKVAFWNEVWTLCERMGMDYASVRDAVVDEGRVNVLHTRVPGPDGRRGFGGSCLPKDLSELIRQMDALDLQPGVCRAAYDRNELLDRPRSAESR